VLEELHAGLWWGIVLAVLGALFLYLHWPGKERSVLDEEDNSILSVDTDDKN
jgi:hypothetical protein